MADSDVERRLAELERAVAELRARPDGGPAPSAGLVGDQFWALNELEARAPGGAVIYVGSAVTPTGGVVKWQYGELAGVLFDRDWSGEAERLAALGSPVRLRILHAVAHGIDSAPALAEQVEAGTTGQIYHHIKELVAAGWLQSPKRGRFAIPASRVIPLLAILAASGTPLA